MRISFTGPQCSGKTTLLEKCKSHYGDRFDYVEEVTRPALKEGLQINEQGNNKTQLYILGEHIENDNLENVIMDRCIIDGWVYTSYLSMEGKVSDIVRTVFDRTFDSLIRNLNIVFYTKPVPFVTDGVRSTNEKFRKNITSIFETFIPVIKRDRRFKGKIIDLSGDVETRFKTIRTAIDKYDQSLRQRKRKQSIRQSR
jgi:nicotinamide riboside kinase